MQITSTMKYHFSPIRMVMKQKTYDIESCGDWEILDHTVSWCSYLKRYLTVFTQSKRSILLFCILSTTWILKIYEVSMSRNVGIPIISTRVMTVIKMYKNVSITKLIRE
jgi:hypothetical protein